MSTSTEEMYPNPQGPMIDQILSCELFGGLLNHKATIIFFFSYRGSILVLFIIVYIYMYVDL